MTTKNPHAQALGRLGGSVKSERKAEAARLNGQKGGRKRPVDSDDISNPSVVH